MSNSMRSHPNRILRLVLVYVFFPTVLLLSLCGDKSTNGPTVDPNDTLAVNDSIAFSASPATSSVKLSWNYNDSLKYVLYWSENPDVSREDNTIMNVTSPFTHDGLKNNHSYYYRLGIIDDSEVIALSSEVKVTTRQVNNVPNEIVLYASGGDQKVVLFWENLVKPVTAVVYWSKNSDFTGENCQKMTIHENPYTHTGLLNDITYYYRIALVDADGQEGDWSEQVEAYTRATTEIPVFPTNVKVQERNTMLTITWTPDGSATSYYVYWAKSSGVDKNCSKEKSMSNVFHFANLVNGTTYYLRISTENSKGEGQLSKEVSGTPKVLEPPRMEAVPGYDDVDLKWGAVSNANSYTLTCRSDSGTSETFKNVRSPFTHDNLIPGVDYTYSIVSINLDRESEPFTVTSSPLGLSAPSPYADTIKYRENTVAWQPVEFADSYILYWGDTTVTAAAANRVDMGAATTYTHSDLIPQKKYRYRVRAVKGSDSSDLSSELACVAKGLPAPKGVRLVPGYRTVTITLDSAYKMPAGRQDTSVRFNLYWDDVLPIQNTPLTWSRKSAHLIAGVTLPYSLTGLDIKRPCYVCLGVVDGEFEGDLTAILNTNTLDLSPPDSFRIAIEGYKELTLLWKNVDSANSYNIYWSSTSDSVAKSSEKFSTDKSPFVHTGLAVGTKYRYRVTSVDGDYESNLSVIRSATVNPLSPPSNINLRPDVTSIALSWNRVVTASSYNVYWSKTNNVSLSSEKFSCVGIDTVHGGLTPGTPYYYAVTSVNGVDESGLSTVRNTTTASLLPPSGITISSGYCSIHLAWSKAQGAESYNVYVSEDSTVDTTSRRIPVTGDSTDLTGLASWKTYHFKIASVKDGFESALSGEVHKETAGLRRPNAGISSQYGAISLIWTRVPYAQSYIVAWADTTHEVGPVDSITVTDTFFLHTGLIPLQAYWYTIIAVNGNDRSPPSTVVAARTDGMIAPVFQKVEEIYRGYRFSWKSVKYATSYKFSWSDTVLTVGTPHTVTTTDTFYTQENLLPNELYWFQVSGLRDDEEGKPSAEYVVKAQGLTPPSFLLTPMPSAVRITASSKYADYFIIYWSYEISVGETSDTLIMQKDEEYLDHPFDALLDSGKTRYYRVVAVRGGDKSEMSELGSILLGN